MRKSRTTKDLLSDAVSRRSSNTPPQQYSEQNQYSSSLLRENFL